MRTVPCVTWSATARSVVMVALLAASSSGCATVDGPGRGEALLFAPSTVAVSGNDTLLMVQGRIFEPEASAFRRELIDLAALRMGVDSKDPIYRERMGYFVSDSKKNVRIAVNVGEQVVTLQPSDSAGYVTVDVRLTDAQVTQLAREGRISFASVPTPTNSSRFSGVAILVPETGITVITDMDDTIKVTNMRNREEAKANTFVRPFRPVPGMPELYRGWEQALGPRIHFHVVSAGPWQFHEPLRRFTEDARFPAFTWDMRSVDIMNLEVLLEETVVMDPQRLYDFKLATIHAFMKRFPKRHVVLVGDSGERDPEVYAQILNGFGDRVDAVFIRDVTGEDRTAARYQKLFSSAAASAKLRVFRDPADLPALSEMTGK